MNAETLAPTERMTVTSTDGSTIAYDLSGSGPVVVLVAQALSDRGDNRRLAGLLAANHTVINFDRRGRGGSTEAGSWSADREIEDIEALIDQHGGSAAVFGASAGAVLALDAANSLGGKVSKVVSFEAPVISTTAGHQSPGTWRRGSGSSSTTGAAPRQCPCSSRKPSAPRLR